MSRANFASFVILGLLLLGTLGLSTVGTSTPSEAAGGSQIVQHSELIRFLPDAPSGWSRQAEEWSIAEGTYNISANYPYPYERIDAYVSISDHGIRFSEQDFWDRFFGPERDTTAVTVQGFQARELEHDSSYFLGVNINNRFLVHIYTNRDRETLYYFADLIDCNGLAALGDAGGKTQGSQPVQPTELIEFLPDAPSGWVREVEGLRFAEGTYNASTNTDFERMDAYVGIQDHGSTVSEQEFWDRLPEPEGEIKSVTIKGFQAREEYVTDFSYYILLVNIHNRFLVVITTARDRETLYYFADAIDYNELATLDESSEEVKTPGFEFGFVIIVLFTIEYLVLRSSKRGN
jgi:hypothetical protein